MNYEKKYKDEIAFIKKHQGGVLLNEYDLPDLLYFMKHYKSENIASEGNQGTEPALPIQNVVCCPLCFSDDTYLNRGTLHICRVCNHHF